MSNTTLTDATVRVGMIVTPAPDDSRVPVHTLGEKYRVAKVPKGSRKMVAASNLRPGGRGINFPSELLVETTEDAPAPRVTMKPFIAHERVFLGEVVKLTEPFIKGDFRYDTDTPMVVIGFGTRGGRDVTHLARLGGDDNRYLRLGPDKFKKEV